MRIGELPDTVQKAWGPDVVKDFSAWLDGKLREARLAPGIQISAFVARQKVNALMLEQVSNLLLADEPRLVRQPDERWVWRVPVDLTFPSHGRVGRVGELDVDAHYGEVRYTDALLAQMADRVSPPGRAGSTPDQMSDILPVPHYPQSAEGYCLSACARMVLAYLGVERAEAKVSRVLGAQEYGTPSFAIQRLADLGVQVTYRQWPLPELMTTLTSKQPVIVFVRTGFLGYWTEDVAHAVVIVGVEEGHHFWINDPAREQAPLIVSWDGLLAAWAEFDYRGATLSPVR